MRKTENNPETLPENQQAPAAAEEILSRKRRMALVSYLAILFAVAFLLVAISMVIENRQLQESEGNLNSRIRQIQADNEVLQEKNKKMTEENTAVKQQLNEAQQENAAAAASIETLTGEKQTLTEQKQALEEEKHTLTEERDKLKNRADESRQVHELLWQAMAADEEGNLSRVAELLAQIEPLEDLLSETEREIYEELKIA